MSSSNDNYINRIILNDTVSIVEIKKMRIRLEVGHERWVIKAAVTVEVCQWHSHGQTEKNHEKHQSGQSITVLTFETHTSKILAWNSTATAAATTTCLVTNDEPKYSYYSTSRMWSQPRGPRLQGLVYRCQPNVSVTYAQACSPPTQNTENWSTVAEWLMRGHRHSSTCRLLHNSEHVRLM